MFLEQLSRKRYPLKLIREFRIKRLTIETDAQLPYEFSLAEAEKPFAQLGHLQLDKRYLQALGFNHQRCQSVHCVITHAEESSQLRLCLIFQVTRLLRTEVWEAPAQPLLGKNTVYYPLHLHSSHKHETDYHGELQVPLTEKEFNACRQLSTGTLMMLYPDFVQSVDADQPEILIDTADMRPFK